MAVMSMMSVMLVIPVIPMISVISVRSALPARFPALRRGRLSPQLRGQPLAAAAARRGQVAAPGTLIAVRHLF